MKVKILDVAVEKVTKGRNSYEKAVVTYTYNGEARSQTMLSFANPAVYKKVKEKVGQEVEITITKNAAGYNEWASLDEVGSATPEATSAAPVATTRVTGSNYETATERAAKQAYIIKQSSISSAIALAASNKEKASPQEIIAIAEQFVAYVFNQGLTEVPSDTP